MSSVSLLDMGLSLVLAFGLGLFIFLIYKKTFAGVMILFAVPAIIFAIIWYFQAFRSDIEYEYTYYDGEFRFARIKAKRKRKGLGRVQMEDVLALAPKGDRSVYKYENDNSLACKDLTSGESGTKIYELVFKGEKGINRYEFEPDEEMLDAVMVKYPRAVIK